MSHCQRIQRKCHAVTVSSEMTLLTLLYRSLCNLACTYTWPGAKRWHAKMCHSILLSSGARSEIGAFLTHVDSAHSTDTSLCLNNSCSCTVPYRTRSVNRSFWEWKCERVRAFADSYQNKHASNYICSTCSARSNLGLTVSVVDVFFNAPSVFHPNSVSTCKNIISNSE